MANTSFFYEINEDGVYERVGRRASFDTSSLTKENGLRYIGVTTITKILANPLEHEISIGL